MVVRKKSEEPSINIDEVLIDKGSKVVTNESGPVERKVKPEDGSRTTVVIRDEVVNRMDPVAMPEGNSYEIVGQATNGKETVELTHKYRPDVVRMNVKVPRVDGVTAAGIICDENTVPAVMPTTFPQTDLVKKATGIGIMAYVVKPYEESKLLLTLEMTMSHLAEINDLLDSVEHGKRKLKEIIDQLKKAEEKLERAEDTLEEHKLASHVRGLSMDRVGFSEQDAFRQIQKASVGQRIPRKCPTQAIIAEYGDPKSSGPSEHQLLASPY